MHLEPLLVNCPSAGVCVPVDWRQRLSANLGRSRQHANLVQRQMLFDASHPLVPMVTLAAGVFLLLAPRIVSVAVAIYLIVAGLFGLNGIYHFFK